MEILLTVLLIAGSLALFLYGMKVMGDGLQQGAGDKLSRVLGYMTGNTFTACFTGFAVTAVIQSSGATTAMVVSFVNAGMLSLKQAIGVIMGANIGTTVTAWIVSVVGVSSLPITTLALPIIGIGFFMRVIKWKHQEFGNAVLGFGILFLGLAFLTTSMPKLDDKTVSSFIQDFQGSGFLFILICAAAGLVMTLIMHSSSASTAIMLTMANNNIIDFRMSCAMILGANIGSCIDALLASIGTRTNARRAALVHILFNVIGAIVAMIFFSPLCNFVLFISPDLVTTQLAMFHSMFNILNTILFFPFVKPFAAFVSFLIKDKPGEQEEKQFYEFEYATNSLRDTPELQVFQAKKEIQSLAALVSKMYASLRTSMQNLNAASTDKLKKDLGLKEDYADQMREKITLFLVECTKRQLNKKTQHNVVLMIRIIADLEDMTDNCYSICILLERSVKKDQIFKSAEMEALDPYMLLVSDFLVFIGDHLGGKLTQEEIIYAKSMEDKIDLSRNKLRKLGRKRIEEGENVKTELLFIDLVRRIERLGDFCYSISTSMAHMV
ncbi:MAG: Na/Pi cotransporter family protein [Spirochaetaceae bacterium]|jgi:phosphate:Na+ symporter|nr:Na/Pi cotransporter family protein [Spirochaetaceae bacterium]